MITPMDTSNCITPHTLMERLWDSEADVCEYIRLSGESFEAIYTRLGKFGQQTYSPESVCNLLKTLGTYCLHRELPYMDTTINRTIMSIRLVPAVYFGIGASGEAVVGIFRPFRDMTLGRSTPPQSAIDAETANMEVHRLREAILQGGKGHHMSTV